MRQPEMTPGSPSSAAAAQSLRGWAATVPAAALVWSSLGVVAGGLTGVFITWGRVAGRSVLAEQLPAAVGGGLGSLGIVVVGVVLLGASVRRFDWDMPALPASAGPRRLATGWLLAGCLVAAGFVAIAVGWRGAAAATEAAFQIPYVVSGGLGGLGLIIVGSAVAVIHDGRHEREQFRRTIDELLGAAPQDRPHDGDGPV